MRNVISGAILALVVSSPALAATPSWSVSERSGAVSIMHGGVSRIAIKDGDVATGDIVATGPTGRAVLVRGEEFLVVAPNSRLRVADPAQSGGFVQIIEEAGNVIYRIKRMTMQHFAVKTPYMAAVVKGTTFSVSVGPEGTSVQVIEGAVEVATTDGGARELLRPGMVAAVSARDLGRMRIDGETSRVIVSPNAPAPDAASDLSVAPATADSPQNRIDTPVREPSVSIASLTGGLIEGDATIPVVLASNQTAKGSALLQTASAATTTGVSNDSTSLTVPPPTLDSSPANPAPVDVVPAIAPIPPTTAPPTSAASTVTAVIETVEPVVTTAPVVTASAPVVTAAAPVVASAPVVTAAAPMIAPLPAVTAAEPVITAAAPVVAPLPAVTAVEPVITAAAPVVAPAPVVTAAAPVVTATAPVVTAAAPVVTATAPVVTAAANAPTTTATMPSTLSWITAARQIISAYLAKQQQPGGNDRRIGGH